MMFRGRTPRSIHKLRRAVACVAESLESRRMLTTLSTDGTHPANFDFIDANNNLFTIRLTGNVTAEFVGMNVRGNGTQVIRDLVAPPGDTLPANFIGINLFSIYISAGDDTGTISISRYTVNTTTHVRTYLPYSGSPGTMLLDPLNPPPAELPANGALYIGARTPLQDGNDVYAEPIIYNSFKGTIGVRPASRGIYAGVQTAAGVSIGKVLLGGVVTGLVYLQGNIDTFYAGELLTGDLGGHAPGLTSNNFSVAGTIRHLIVEGDIGTVSLGGASFTSKFDAQIGGKLGEAYVGGSYDGGFDIVNATTVPGFTTQMTESEANNSAAPAISFLQGTLNLGASRNDSADTPQYLFTADSTRLNKLNVVDIAGSVTNISDPADYYGLPLMAGQKVTFTVSSVANAFVNWELIDPDGRRIESTDSDFDPKVRIPNPLDPKSVISPRANLSYTFTADRPGVYKIGVLVGSTQGPDNYGLIVSNAGDIAIGGLRAVGDLNITNQDSGVTVEKGDLGAIENSSSFTVSSPAGLKILNGNIRSIVGGSIDLGQQLNLPNGSVGLLDATSAAGLIAGNTAAESLYDDYNTTTADTVAIGGDYQVIRSAGGITANFVAKGNIGTIVATKQVRDVLLPDSITSHVIVVNADGIGPQGKIDLIDSGLDFGEAIFGGPAIYTGPGGNVRYMRIRATVYGDRFFGNNPSSVETFPQGQTISKIDDSGATLTIQPTSIVTSAATATTAGTVVRGAISITTYGVREKGGVIIARIDSSTGINLTSAGAGASAEVGEFRTGFAQSSALTFNTTQRRVGYVTTSGTTTTLGNNAPIPLDVILRGNAPISIYDITSTGDGGELTTASIGSANFSKIQNFTTGEILNVFAGSIGYLSAERIGIPVTQATASTLMGITLGGNSTFPWSQPSIMVRASNYIDISSKTYLGNIYARGDVSGLNGVINNIRANSDGVNVKEIWEGINAPIVADWMQNVYIGEGILSTGNGDFSRAGLYADAPVVPAYGRIGPVTGDNGAQIRGDVIAQNYIDSITLQNGSIVDADIATNDISGVGESTDATIRGTETYPPTTGIVKPTPLFDIGSITLTGNGGIIGSTIATGEFGPITVSGGFGILTTLIKSITARKASASISVSGLGIRNTLINAGQSMDSVVLTDLSGQTLNLSAYSPYVLQAATTRYDVFSGFGFAKWNDLYIATGVSPRKPAIAGLTTAGILEDVDIRGGTNLNLVKAYAIRASDPQGTSITSSKYPSRIAFANTIGSIQTSTFINGAQITTGNLKTLTVGGDIRNTKLDVAGAIGTISAKAVRDSVTIRTSGPNGTIGAINVNGNFTPYELVASKNIGSISVSGSLSTNAASLFGLRAPNIASLLVDGDIATGSFIRVTGKINNLFVGGDVQVGSKILAGSYGTKTIKGTIFGQVAIG